MKYSIIASLLLLAGTSASAQSGPDFNALANSALAGKATLAPSASPAPEASKAEKSKPAESAIPADVAQRAKESIKATPAPKAEEPKKAEVPKLVAREVPDLMPTPVSVSGPGMKKSESLALPQPVMTPDVADSKVEPSLKAVRKWLGKSSGVTVEGGVVRYPFDNMEPVLVCAPLRVCTIELQKGEKVINVAVGDSARWQAHEASGAGKTYIIIKTMGDEGEINSMATNLLVTTDKRIYSISLKGSNTDYTPKIGFYYPAEVVQNWEKKEEASSSATASPTSTGKGLMVDMAKADFGYSIEGDDDLKPSRAFDDGTRTYLVMTGKQTPVVMVDNEVVNFRYLDGHYVIDKVGKEIALFSGVGGDQKKATATKGRAKFLGIF